MYVKDGRTLTVLQHKYELAGVGFFTNLMRLLTDTPDHYLNLSSESDSLYMASKIGCDEESMTGYIETMVTTNKLHNELWKTFKIVYCPDLIESLAPLYEKRKAHTITVEEIFRRVSDPESTFRGALNVTETPVTGAETPQSIVEYSRVKERKEEKSAKTRHPTLDVPMNQTRYTSLCKKFGKATVDEAIQERIDWENGKGKPKAKDYASAAASWMKKDGAEPLPGAQVKVDMNNHPPACDCGGKVVAVDGEATCRECGAWWELTDGAWARMVEVG